MNDNRKCEFRMFFRISGARSAKKSGIMGVKIPFDPNIIISVSERMEKDEGSDRYRGSHGGRG